MARITDAPRKNGRDTVVVKTGTNQKKNNKAYRWWLADSKKALSEQVLSTVTFLKEQQQWRYRQATVYARLYGNMPLQNFFGFSSIKMAVGQNLPIDRPTMNVVQSCVDTLVSRITQQRPRPVFLTDNGDYRLRNMAKQMNSFIQGEFYQMKAYELGALLLRDAAVWGTGVAKVLEKNERVALERRMPMELLVDENDAIYGDPRCLYEMKLVDRSVLAAQIPEKRSLIENAQQGFPYSESDQTASDQIIVAEAWHLPSGPDATDGRHCIVCSEGTILDEDWKKDSFPFVFLHYSPRPMGFWGQGLAEQLMGTQVEINKLLMTISQSINLVGVPRVFVEDGSKVVKAHLNNAIGSIVTYRGTKPQYEVAPCVPQELYAQLQRLVEYAYQQSGISTLAASAQKPAGLNSGEALRNYDDIQSDRFAALVKRYDQFYIDLAYQNIYEAKEICEDTGKYTTVYPNKDGTREIDLPKADLLENPIIQCFDSSSLPRDPAGRLQKVTELMQGGLLSPDEGRRLLDFPDLEQVDKLKSAREEKILQDLDQIVESSKYNPPDPFTDLMKAEELVVDYINLYGPAKLEESKMQLLRNYFTQVQTLKQAAMPPPMPGMPSAGGPPGLNMVPGPGNSPAAIGVPQSPPTNDLMPIGAA
jgi:hypothetical protein